MRVYSGRNAMPRLRYIGIRKDTEDQRDDRILQKDRRKLKEMCRIQISVAHQCGYCSTVRSNVAKAEGLTENMINDLFSFETSRHFTPREKAALRYASLFKQGRHAIDKDEVYQALAKHFGDEEIIELGRLCAQTDGVGKFVKSLNVISWEEACEINPRLGQTATQVAAE
jgi:AhpD family alkylhydroperoxidase